MKFDTAQVRFGALLDKAQRETTSLYLQGIISADAIKERSIRICALRRRGYELARLKARHHGMRFQHERIMTRLRAAVRNGQTLVALDCGWFFDDPPCEIGVTFCHKGVLSTYNYGAEEVPFRHGAKCHYGPSVLVPRATLRDYAVKALKRSDVAVFHEVGSDLPKLSLDSADLGFYVDTAALTAGWFLDSRSPDGKTRLSLEELCQRYGIDTTDNHVSGNDSHRTMLVLLKMIQDPTPLPWRFKP